MQRTDNGLAQATGATRDSGTTEDVQRFLRMLPRVVKMALERMFHTCCRDFFIATRFPFYVKAGFFIVFSLVFIGFRASKGLQVGPHVGPRLGRHLGGVLELSWEGFGRPRRAQEGPRWRQDASRWRQDGLKMAPRRAKEAPRRPKMPPRRSKTAPRRSKSVKSQKH